MMLITIFIATSLVSGGVFGFFVAHTYYTRQQRSEQKSMLEQAPTSMLEVELERRGTTDKSPYRR